jgi:D-amino-acid dehydrogenase
MTPNPALNGTGERRRAVVVGAGIVGICVASRLEREGWRVTLLDRAGPAEGASFGNASVLATEAVVPVATPGIAWRVPGLLADPLGPLALRWGYLPRLAPWLIRFIAASRPDRVEEISRALAALLSGAVEAYRPYLEAAGVQDMIVRRGWIGAYTTRDGFEASAADRTLQRRRGVELHEIGPSEMRQMEPALASDLHAGVFYPNVAHSVQSYRLATRLAEAFQAEGGEILRAEALGFEVSEGRITAVRSAEGPLPCGAVVLTAGAWSKGLAGELGAEVPLDTERGYHLSIPDPGIELSRPVYSTEFAMACTPLEDGLRLGGTVEMGGLAAPPNWKRAEVLSQRAKRLFPDLDPAGASRWMGFRPSLPDSLPVIGLSPRYPNAALAFGHGHLGLTLAARTANLIADLLAGRDPDIDPRPYRADRF